MSNHRAKRAKRARETIQAIDILDKNDVYVLMDVLDEITDSIDKHLSDDKKQEMIDMVVSEMRLYMMYKNRSEDE